jgi:serine/threonine-protein kinase
VRGPDAHEGIVHGDVTPSNEIACFDGAVKVLDFGIARPVGLAAASGVGGKLPYLPPEVIVGGAPDVRTDIYGLGLVLYEMLTGQRVYRAESDAEIIRRVMHDPVHAPSTHVPGLPPVLDQLVMTLVARDRAVRPGSAVDVAESLDRILAGRFGAADLATLVDKLATRTNESTTVTATPVGRTEPVDAARAGQHTAVATDSSVPLPRARRHWIAAIAGGVALAGGIAAWQLTARETAPSASEKTDTVVPMRTSEQPAPTADSPPTPAPSTPAATEAPSEAAPVAEPVRAAPAKRVVKRSRPSANKPSTPSTDPGPGSGGISPGYLANPFEKKK